jgi:hypothetical protein
MKSGDSCAMEPESGPPFARISPESEDFDLFVQVRVAEVGSGGDEVFGLRVYTTEKLALPMVSL